LAVCEPVPEKENELDGNDIGRPMDFPVVEEGRRKAGIREVKVTRSSS